VFSDIIGSEFLRIKHNKMKNINVQPKKKLTKTEAEDPKRHNRMWNLLVGILLIAIVLVGVIFLPRISTSVEVIETVPLNFAEVIITDLIQEESYDGNIGSIQDDPVKTMLGGTITDLPEAGEVISQGESLFAINNQSVILLYGDLPAYRDIAIGSEVFTISNQSNGTVTWVPEPGTLIQQGNVLYRVDDQPVIALYGEGPAYRLLTGTTADPLVGYDVLQLEQALVALGYDDEGNLEPDDTFSFRTTRAIRDFQADLGTEQDGNLDLGEVVFIHGPSQVVENLVHPGDPAGGGVMRITTGNLANGADILQLENGLLDLGFDIEGTLVADGTYTIETHQAIIAFQTAVGLEPDGILNLGEIVFLPGSVRVTNQLSTAGSTVGPATPILGISLSEKVVYMALPADDQGILSVGDAVTVELPDNTNVPATVIFVSQSAIAGQNEWDPAWFEVRIMLDDPSMAQGLDEAPVDIIVVSDSVQDVMAIPVSALVALLEGGYAVEKSTGNGQVTLTAVEVGFFGSNNLIEILSSELALGNQVVVP
jgi:peptidoglycan hydrolase-like protein with peptidoglycan-binding domain